MDKRTVSSWTAVESETHKALCDEAAEHGRIHQKSSLSLDSSENCQEICNTCSQEEATVLSPDLVESVSGGQAVSKAIRELSGSTEAAPAGKCKENHT